MEFADFSKHLCKSNHYLASDVIVVYTTARSTAGRTLVA